MRVGGKTIEPSGWEEEEKNHGGLLPELAHKELKELVAQDEHGPCMYLQAGTKGDACNPDQKVRSSIMQ